jgi:hypothetical protein
MAVASPGRGVVERTLAWLYQFPRLNMRYERRVCPRGISDARIVTHLLELPEADSLLLNALL